MIHHCFSGSLACSGCNPCSACADVVQERALPGAAVAAGLDGSLLALVHIFARALHQIDTQYRLGVDPAQIAEANGVPLSGVFPSAEAQAEAFVAGYQGAFGLLVRQMQLDPTLGGRPNTRLVSTNLDEATSGSRDSGTQGETTRQEPPTTAAQAEVSSSPSQPEPQGPGTSSPGQTLTGPATTADFEGFLKKKPAPEPSPMTSPMDAEDIAAAAVPAPSSANGLGEEVTP